MRRLVFPDGTAIGANQLNGIAVSPDAQTLWLTLSGAVPGYPDAPGVLIEAPAFGPVHTAEADEHERLVADGAGFFAHDFTPEEGLGPLFNATSCRECHQTPTVGGMGKDGLGIALRIGRLDGGRFDPLTDREREVMALVAEGLTNDEIAVRLTVSPATARTHVSRAMVKLGARDRAQLVVFAYEAGLVRPSWS